MRLLMRYRIYNKTLYIAIEIQEWPDPTRGSLRELDIGNLLWVGIKTKIYGLNVNSGEPIQWLGDWMQLRV
jgi:hypothetical protein